MEKTNNRNLVVNYINRKYFKTMEKSRNKENFLEKIELNYLEKSQNYLEYTYKNLLFLKDNTKNKFIYNHKEFFNKYIQVIDTTKGINSDNIEILDSYQEPFLKEKDKTLINKIYSRVNTLDHINKDRESFFITITNISEYHYYSNNRKNPKCISKTFEENIENSIIKMNEITRYFYKAIKKRLSMNKLNTKFDYYKVYEHHKKDLSIHSHINIYMDKDPQYKEILLSSFESTIKHFNLKKVDFQVIKNIKNVEVEGSKIEHLKNSKSSSYLMKYLMKSINTDDNFYLYFRKYFNKYRMFTSSRLPKKLKEIEYTYTHLKKEKPKLLRKLKTFDTPLYINLIKYIDRNIDFKYKTEKREQLDYKRFNRYLNTLLNKYKSIFKVNTNTAEFFNRLTYKILKKINRFITVIEYQVLDKVKDKKTKKIIYDNNTYSKNEYVINDFIKGLGVYKND